jgi:hypothetical protein
MALPLFLLAAQAAGIGANIYKNRKEQRFLRKQENIINNYETDLSAFEQASDLNNAQALSIAREGYGIADENYKNMEEALGIEKSFLKTRMEQEALAFTEASAINSEELRGVLSSQRAIMGARGQAQGQGSARAVQEASIHAYGEDERARAISQNFRNLQLKGQAALYDAKSKANELNRVAAYNQVSGNINQLNAANLQTKAGFAGTRAGLAGKRGEIKQSRSRSNIELFGSILGQVPFSEMSGIFLNQTNVGSSPGYNGTRLTEAQRNRLIGRL